MTQGNPKTWVAAEERPRRRVGRIVFWALVGLAAALLITSAAIPVVAIQPYLEQSTSMQNSIAPGDRILVAPGAELRRGDVVVLHVPAKVSGTNDLFIKRVIGLPGDHVACCNAKGRITVNGKPLRETYLYPGNPPSRTRFSVTVGRGRIFVLGDHRNISVDSRKWGAVPVSGVVGQVLFVLQGSSLSVVRTPQTFISDGLAPPDTRPDFYIRLAFLALGCVVALLLLALFGTIRFMIRKRQARRAPPPAPPGPRRLVEPIYGVYRAPPEPPGKIADAS
jgi:signal peptidase I